MQYVNLAPNPNQTVQIVLAGQNCAIELRTLDGYDFTVDTLLDTPQPYLAFSLDVSGVSVTANALCLNEKRILINRQYLGFVGDFMFIDTQRSDDPQYTGLGTRWVLVYIEDSDLEVIES